MAVCSKERLALILLCRLMTKSKKKKKNQFLVRNVFLHLLHLVSFSNASLWFESLSIHALYHWNHYRAFSFVQKQYLFFNMYLQVPTVVLWALWVLRDIFWLTDCQYCVGSKHLNCSITSCFSKLEHRSYLKSVGQDRKNKYIDILSKKYSEISICFWILEKTPREFLSLMDMLFHLVLLGIRLCHFCPNALS